MSEYYRAQRVRNLYDPDSTKPYKISRSKLELFLKCQRCFYIDRRLGVGQPPGYPFNLNIAVDSLLKTEFDYYRVRQETPPLLIEHGVDAIPYLHPKLDEWRNSLHYGIQYSIPGGNFIFTGGVDDVWIDLKKQELIIVDYKATSKKDQVSLDAEWQIGYKRQAEIYQWLFRQNGFKVSDIAYFVYCNGRADLEQFEKRLEFTVSLLPYTGNDSWVGGAIQSATSCLKSNQIPPSSDNCDYCEYIKAISKYST